VVDKKVVGLVVGSCSCGGCCGGFNSGGVDEDYLMNNLICLGTYHRSDADC